MTSDLLPNPSVKRPFSLSIGQLTFGSFLLVLAVIIITSTASVVAMVVKTIHPMQGRGGVIRATTSLPQFAGEIECREVFAVACRGHRVSG